LLFFSFLQNLAIKKNTFARFAVKNFSFCILQLFSFLILPKRSLRALNLYRFFFNDAIFHAFNDSWHSIHGQSFAGASICDTLGRQRGILLFANQVLLFIHLLFLSPGGYLNCLK